MANEIFRPKRPESNEDKPKKPENVRPPTDNPDAPIKMTGNIPPAFLAAITKGEPVEEKVEIPQVRETMRVTGSSKLEELLQAIRENTAIYEEVTLPSLGRFYNGTDGPVNGKIHIRPMTGEEEQILATPRHVKKGNAINMIFERCIKEKYNPADFLVQDRTFLLIFLRGISYTPNYEVEVKCPNCDKKFGHTVNLNLPKEECPESFNPSSLEDKLPTTGLRFSYRLPVGGDEQRVQEYRDRRLREFEDNGLTDDSSLFRMASLIKNVEGLTDRSEIMQLLRKLPINDVAYIRNCVNEPPFGIDTKIEMNCPGCLSEFEMELPLEANFFFPKPKKKTEQA